MVPTRAGAGRGRGRGSGRGGTARQSASEDERAKRPKDNRAVRFATQGSSATSGRKQTPRNAMRGGNTTSRFPAAPSGPRKTATTRANGQDAGKWQGSSVAGHSNAQSFQQRYQSLKLSREKERAAAIASGLLMAPGQQIDLDKAVKPRGTCQDMCPEFERVERVVQNDVWAAEVDPDSESNFQGSARQAPDESRMVKKFRRSAAGLDEQLPSDLRPPTVLKKTLDYLFNDVIGTASLASVHHFVWDRTRAIRNDFSIQQITKIEDLRIAIECFERIARFHITSIHHLATPEKPYDKYDIQQEREQLDKTLLSLVMYYDDSRGKVDSPNEAEFRSYLVLFQIQDPIPDLEDRIQTWPSHLIQHPRIQRARELYSAAANTADSQGPLRPRANHPIAQADWRKFWKIVQSNQVSYLMACVAEIYFNEIRKMTLQAIVIAYKRGGNSKNQDWKIDELLEVLGFDSDIQVEEFLRNYGLEVAENAHGIKYVDLNSIAGRELPDPMNPPKQIRSEIVEIKRYGRTLPAVMNGLSVRDAKAAGLVEVMTVEDEMSQDSEQEDTLFVPDPQPQMTAPTTVLNPMASEFERPVQGLFSRPSIVEEQFKPQTTQFSFTPENKSIFNGFANSTSPFTFTSAAPPAGKLEPNPPSSSEPSKNSLFKAPPATFTHIANRPVGNSSPVFTQTSDSRPSHQQQPSLVFNFGTPSTVKKPNEGAASTAQSPAQSTANPPPVPSIFNFTSQSSDKTEQQPPPKISNPLESLQPKPSSFTFKPSQPLQPVNATTIQPVLSLPQTGHEATVDASPKDQTHSRLSQARRKIPAPGAPITPQITQDVKAGPVSSPGPSAQKLAEIAAKKSKLLDKVAETMMMEPYGLLDHFLEFIAGPLILKAQRQVEAEEMQRQADEFRLRTLSRRYGERWRQICWNRRLLRRGQARRKRLTKDADVRSRHSRNTSITSQLEAFRESVSSRSSRHSSKEIPVETFDGGQHNELQKAVPPSQSMHGEIHPMIPSTITKENQALAQSLVDRSRDEAFNRRYWVSDSRSQHQSGTTALEKYTANAENSSLGYSSPVRRYTHRTDTTRSSYFKLKALGIDPTGERLQVPPSPVHLELKRQRSMESELVAVPEAKRISPGAAASIRSSEPDWPAINGISHAKKQNSNTQLQPPKLNSSTANATDTAAIDDPVLAAARATRNAMAESISFFREETAREDERELERRRQQQRQQQQQHEQEQQRLSPRSDLSKSKFRVSKFLPRNQSSSGKFHTSITSGGRSARPFTEVFLKRSTHETAVRPPGPFDADERAPNSNIRMLHRDIEWHSDAPGADNRSEDEDASGTYEDHTGDWEHEDHENSEADYADGLVDEGLGDDLEEDLDAENEQRYGGVHIGGVASPFTISPADRSRHDSPWSGKGGTSIEDAIEL